MVTTTTRTLPTTPVATEREEALNGLFTTALEGGIGYWSTCSLYRWSVEVDGRQVEARDFIAVVQDVEDDDAPELVIDRNVIRSGMARLYRHLIGLGDDANRYHLQAVRNFRAGKWDDLDYDADTADMVVQFGLFNELRYA
jgi:hypothetical protein